MIKLTSEKMNNHKLNDNELLIKNKNEIQSYFLLSLGHELRTPLNVILGFSQLLKQVNSTNLTHEQLSNVEEIIQSANQLVKISEETLAWAKVGMGIHNASLSVVKLSEVISRIWHLLYVEHRLKNVRLTIKLNQQTVSMKDLSVISTLVIADTLILQQAMLNIIIMLVKNIPNHGIITINIDNNDEKLKIKEVVQITIYSNHTAYNSVEKAKLSSTTHLNHNKSHDVNAQLIELSLANAKRLIQTINGKFIINKNKSDQEIFTIELDSSQNSLSNKKSFTNILYIEDNPATVRLVKQLLKNIGEFTFHSANSAQSGLEKATRITPQLILIDINLPDFDGLELVNSLKTIANLKNTKFIAISGEIDQTAIEEALNSGFDDYITKPICIEEFSRKTKLFLEHIDLS